MGAKPRDILALILRESARLTLSGTAAGLLLAAISARIVARQIYGISPLDPLTFAGVGLLLVVVAMAASYIPAVRAARIDPIVALRCE
jgi:ABC-type antimicrobial peptide transport system permease subunit